MRKLLSHAYVLSFAGTITSSLTGFISIWALARILTPVQLGTWLIYIAAFTFGDMMRSGIVHTALIKYSTTSNKRNIIGSSWVIGIVLSTILVMLLWLLQAGIYSFTGNFFYGEVSLYLPLLLIASFPYTISLWIGQMEEHFKRILYLRLLLTIPLLLFILSGFLFPFQLKTLVQIHLSSYIICSALAIVSGWSCLKDIVQSNVANIKTMLTFGRYTMGTLISTNLLKSTDAFMITVYLGPAALAAYNLPYKLIELIEIPLRSLAATFLPQVVKFNQENELTAVKRLFYQYSFLLTFLLLPVSLLMFLFARDMVVILGGENYTSSANIFRCFVLYSMFLPLDRFLGITLDVLNKPHLNLLKVGGMVMINIIGNMMAIYFTASPFYIALATIITTVSGVVIGWFILKPVLSIQVAELISKGYFTLEHFIDKRIRSSAV